METEIRYMIHSSRLYNWYRAQRIMWPLRPALDAAREARRDLALQEQWEREEGGR